MTNLFRRSSELPGVSKGCVNSPEILQGKEQEFLVFSCSRLSEAVGLGISWRSLLVPNLASVLCNINNQTVEETEIIGKRPERVLGLWGEEVGEKRFS